MEKRMQQAVAETAFLRKTNAALQSSIQEKENEIAALQKRMAMYDGMFAKLKQTNASTLLQLTDCRQELQKNSEELSALRTRMRASAEKVSKTTVQKF